MQSKQTHASFDFNNNAMQKWKLREDQRMLIIKEDEEKKACKKATNNTHEETLWRDEHQNGKFYGIIGILCSNGRLKIQFKENQPKVMKFSEKVNLLLDKELCIQDCIMLESTHAACDGSKKRNLFGGCCVIL